MAAKLFDEIIKFNPYHDARGRFSSANGATSFTYSPGKSKAHDLAIQREKERKTSTTDSAGNTLSPGQAEYFKNSKVRDADGNLMVMYHGTPNAGEISVFDGNKLSNRSTTSQIGQGFYFTNEKKEAEAYMENVDIYGNKSKGTNPHLHEVYLDIRKPFDVKNDTLDLAKAKAVYAEGDYDWFFSESIPFSLNNKTVNGKAYTKSELQQLSKEEKVSLYVDRIFATSGQKGVLSNMVRAYKPTQQDGLLKSMEKNLGVDGIKEEFKPGKFQYAAFSSSQIKSTSNLNPSNDLNINKALLFDDILKYNDRHDKLGRFAPKDGGAVATLKPIKPNPEWLYQPDEETDISDMVENPIPFVGVGMDKKLGILFEDETRQPKFISDTEVNISELQTLQPFVLRSGIENYKPWDDSDRPYVIDFEGQKYVVDGNHRIAQAKIKGEKTVNVDISVRELKVKKSYDDITEVEKFNPFHDRTGRFASASTATSFTYAPGKSKAHDLAIERNKERMAGIMPTAAQEKTLKAIENRTRNLKKEQFRVVDRDGNVIMEKQGDRGSVTYKVGEARDNFPGNITIHNHPDGGTFSTPDLSDIGYGATEIRAASPEGTYIMRNINYKTKWDKNAKGWYDMKEDLEAASEGFKSHRELKKEVRAPFEEKLKPIVDKWAKRKEEGASMDELTAIAKEHSAAWEAAKPEIEVLTRKAYVDQYHQWYKTNAYNYGMEYEFIPSKQTTRKSDAMIFDEIIEKGSDEEIVLDRKIQEDVEEIMAEMLKEYQIPQTTEEAKKSFSIYTTDEDKRLVFGWASVAIKTDGEVVLDRQKDILDPDVLEEAAYDYVLNFRDTGEEHIPTMRKKGKLVESCVFTAEKQKAMGLPEGIVPVGWWIGFKIEDDDAWARVKNGTYKMFSIEGKANREPVEKAKPKAKLFDEIIEKFNPYHDARGRFASANGATSFTYSPGKSPAHDKAIERARDNRARAARSYGATNLKDSIEEINSGKTNSLAKHIGPDGKLTPEREAVHKEIIDKLLKGKIPVEGQATMTMLGGGPASGKSSVMSTNTSQDKHAVTVDPDAIKNMLPGFSEMAKQTNQAAAYYHEESSALAKRFSEVAFNENYNVIYDGTGNGSVNSVMKKVDAAKAKGYRVEAKYVSVDTETAVERNRKRYEDARAKGENPRLVPDDVVRKTHANCTDISVAVADKFDSMEIWDNNGARGSQKLIATGGGGKHLVATDTEKFNNYLSKGMSGLEGFTTLPDGQVIPVK